MRSLKDIFISLHLKASQNPCVGHCTSEANQIYSWPATSVAAGWDILKNQLSENLIFLTNCQRKGLENQSKTKDSWVIS